MKDVKQVSEEYFKQSLEGSSTFKQVAILLEKAAVHLQDAEKIMDEKDFEKILDHTQEAEAIIYAIWGCFQRDTELAAKVTEIFDRFFRQLVLTISRVNTHADKEACQTSIKSLYDMAEYWKKLDEEARAENLELETQMQGEEEVEETTSHDIKA